MMIKELMKWWICPNPGEFKGKYRLVPNRDTSYRLEEWNPKFYRYEYIDIFGNEIEGRLAVKNLERLIINFGEDDG